MKKAGDDRWTDETWDQALETLEWYFGISPDFSIKRKKMPKHQLNMIYTVAGYCNNRRYCRILERL